MRSHLGGIVSMVVGGLPGGPSCEMQMPRSVPACAGRPQLGASCASTQVRAN